MSRPAGEGAGREVSGSRPGWGSENRGSQVLAAVAVLVVIGYAVLATRWVNADPGWYDGLVKPSWQPPDWVFGVAWPYNFVALAVAGVTISWRAPGRPALVWVAVLAANALLALTWAYLFYVPHALTSAAIALGVAALLGWVLTLLAWRAVPWTGVLVLPYAVWLSVATSLAVGFAVGSG